MRRLSPQSAAPPWGRAALCGDGGQRRVRAGRGVPALGPKPRTAPLRIRGRDEVDYGFLRFFGGSYPSSAITFCRSDQTMDLALGFRSR
jgi:hypothetical protein